MQTIGLDGGSSIKPCQIDASQHFYDAFGHWETETSARYIVLLCQEKGGWSPFTKEEIESVYTRRGPGDGFWFNRLIKGGWIVAKGNQYHITQEFVDCVYRSSPANWRQRLSCLVQAFFHRIKLA